MEIMELKKHILNKELPTGVILTGDEGLISIYLNEIYKTFTCKKVNNIQDVLLERSSKVNFQDSNLVYIIFEDDTFKKNSKLWNNSLKNIVFIYSSLTKTEAFSKAFEPNIIWMKFPENVFKAMIKNKLNIKEEDVNWLIQEGKSNYFYCINEADKIGIFDKSLHQSLFNEFRKDKTICKKDTIEAFDFTNAVSERNKVKSLECLSKISKYDILRQLSAIYSNLRTQLLVINHKSSSSDIETKAKEIGISKGAYYHISKNAKYSLEELCNNLLLISDYINKIKLGLLDPVDAIYLFVLRCI